MRGRALGWLVLLAACSAGDLEDDGEPEPAAEPGAGGAGGRTTRPPDGGGGTPVPGREGGAPPADGGAADAAPAASRSGVVISEIMYHPVLEDALEDRHEFVEIHNPGRAPVALAGWKLAGDVAFTFPAGAAIAPGQYLVVAKNRKALAAVAKYGLTEAALLGDYTGHLDNGGGAVSLLDAAGTVVDGVKYKDGFPWPHAADALGAGEDWLPARLLPLAQHRYMGHSLERVSFDVPAGEVSNWVPSPLDGASPGRPNSVSGDPLPVVEALHAGPAGGTGLIRARDRIQIVARFSARGTVRRAEVEYFADDVARADERATRAPMTAAAGGAFEAVLPPHPDNTIVRYRIFADRGAGLERVSPRPSDPHEWHAAFVSPAITAARPETRVYQLFIAPASWSALWDNLQFAGGQLPVENRGCRVNPKWNLRVPAVFVHEGRVHDVRVRYLGSRWNRAGGRTIPTWPHPGPTGPSPLRALSWSVKFPRWARFEKRGTVSLNKLAQGCPGMPSALGERLMSAAGIPASRVRFARVHVNGGYYHYMMDIEHVDDDLLRRHHGPDVPLGDFYKAASGAAWDEGPWGVSDGRELAAHCGFTVLQRYQATWERKTHRWKGHDDIIALTRGLTAARAAGGETLRRFLAEHFDVDKVLTYLAIRNWGTAWDDTYHNFFLYRPPGGKWMLTPWDMEREFGLTTITNRPAPHPNDRPPAQEPFDIGSQITPAVWGQWGYLKDVFPRAYRAELERKIRELRSTILDPANVAKLLDEEAAKWSAGDAGQAPAGQACNFTNTVTVMKQFIRDRDAFSRRVLP